MNKKRLPNEAPASQLEFLFVSETCLSHVDEQVGCCNTIPVQHDHPELHAHCFADEPTAKRLTPGGWPRPDFFDLDTFHVDAELRVRRRSSLNPLANQ
jgi:hypothetical protein